MTTPLTMIARFSVQLNVFSSSMMKTLRFALQALRTSHIIFIFKGVLGSDVDLKVFCEVDRMGKSLGNDAQAQQAFNKLKKKVQKALQDLIKAYEKRLREKSAQIKRKNKKIKDLQAIIKDLKRKLAFAKSKARQIVKA